MKVTYSDKHSSLLRHGIKYDSEEFIVEVGAVPAAAIVMIMRPLVIFVGARNDPDI